MNREFIESLIKLMQENPELKVLCKVDSDIVADDGYAWWLGKINDKWEAEIDEYAQLDDQIIFKSDDDYNYWFEIMFDIDDYADVSDKEWDEFAKKKVDEAANWEKAIFVRVTV